MTLDRRGEFKDLGVIGLTEERSLARKNELIKVVRDAVQEVSSGSGQIIIGDLITDRQKRHAIVFLNKSGLRGRVQIDRSFSYHNGQDLVKGTRILVYPGGHMRPNKI